VKNVGFERLVLCFKKLIQPLIASYSHEMSTDVLNGLFFTRSHSLLVQRRRALLVLSRVRWVATTFAVLTPLWSFIDIVLFPWPLWGWLLCLRILASVAFAFIALRSRERENIFVAYKWLAALYAVPVVFFLVSHPLLSSVAMSGPAAAAAIGYAFLPFVMIAGLSVFPITALEGILFATPLIAAMAISSAFTADLMPFSSHMGALWLLVLLSVVATLAGMSQLHFMMMLVQQSSSDPLTRAQTRQVGEELLGLFFATAQRAGSPFALAFIDLDKFKYVNDTFGHEEGDMTLKNAARSLMECMRRGDIVIRWGGEEFLVVMPNTDAAGAKIAIDRLREHGLGARPDDTPQTASIGIAEKLHDQCDNWSDLVEKADQRMYRAKKSGRDAYVACNDQIFPPRPETTQYQI
jgi:diguanylate cyclase (GGDEF)-like protein